MFFWKKRNIEYFFVILPPKTTKSKKNYNHNVKTQEKKQKLF